MEHMYKYFRDEIIMGSDEFKMFSSFFESNVEYLRKSFKQSFNSKEGKCNIKANNLRKRGNEFYIKKNLKESMESYTDSLRNSVPDTDSYALSFSNKSAVLFEMGELKHCLTCIDLCFESNCPTHIKPKLFLRKAECYFNLDRREQLEQTIKTAKDFINNYSAMNNQERSSYLEKLEKFLNFKTSLPKDKYKLPQEVPLPKLKNGPNDSFLHASSALKLEYNEEKGRHVVAKRDLNVGDVLFIEKAFCSAPVFSSSDIMKINSDKCFHCLKDTFSCIPCRNCIIAVYCDEKCRMKSWEECHQWECAGMQRGIWYELGIGFPAFRTVLKGIPSDFKMLDTSYKDDVNYFGNKDDNYPYFNKLMTNFSKMENVTPILISAAVIVLYLSNYTDFYDWLLSRPRCPVRNRDNLIKFTGGLLSRHIAQLSCNSSVVEHWVLSPEDKVELPNTKVQVACAIYPTISMMNHSCNSNISMYFVQDVAIVKAADTIKKGSEIFNCYGIHYQFSSKAERQEKCEKLYYFTCKCEICQNPYMEYELYESFRCIYCSGPVPNPKNPLCIKCGKSVCLPYRDIEDRINLLNSPLLNEKQILSSLEIINKHLFEKNSYKIKCYKLLCDVYSEKGDFKNLLKYLKLAVDAEKVCRGRWSRTVGLHLYTTCMYALQLLQGEEFAVLKTYRYEINELLKMKNEMKTILNLYYHFEENRFEILDFSMNLMSLLMDDSSTEAQ